MSECKDMLNELVKLSRTLESECGPWRDPAEETRDVQRQERRIIAHVAAIEAQRDAAVKALKGLRALFAGDPGGEFVVTRENGSEVTLADWLIVGEAMAKATAAIEAADERKRFTEDEAPAHSSS